MSYTNGKKGEFTKTIKGLFCWPESILHLCSNNVVLMVAPVRESVPAGDTFNAMFWAAGKLIGLLS